MLYGSVWLAYHCKQTVKAEQSKFKANRIRLIEIRMLGYTVVVSKLSLIKHLHRTYYFVLVHSCAELRLDL